MSLKDKTILITGATAGIGEACARRFAAHKASLILTGRRSEKLEALKASLAADTQIITLDIRDKDAVYASFKSLKADILINNAGLALGLDKAPQTSVTDWEQMIDTNIKGMLYATDALLPGMVERNRGHIVNLGSIAGSYPYPGGNVYGATKAFLKQFSLNLRADLLGKNIRVTNIEPGMVETEFSMVRFHGNQEKAENVYKNTTPLTAEDIAESIECCIQLPDHVNINRLDLMPTFQAFAGLIPPRTE